MCNSPIDIIFSCHPEFYSFGFDTYKDFPTINHGNGFATKLINKIFFEYFKKNITDFTKYIAGDIAKYNGTDKDTLIKINTTLETYLTNKINS